MARYSLLVAIHSPAPTAIVTLQEIRIECFFPADAATAETFKRWAAGDGQKD
jgi:hypothetical protein